MEIAAGFTFGAWEGLLLCLTGSVLGSIIIYGFTRRFGVKDSGSLYLPGKDGFAEIYPKQLPSFSSSSSQGCIPAFFTYK